MEQSPNAVMKSAPCLPRRTGYAKSTAARGQFAVKSVASTTPGKEASCVLGTGGNESKSNAPRRDAPTTPRREECVTGMERYESDPNAQRKVKDAPTKLR